MPVGDADPGRGHGKRLPWVFVVLILAVVTSSSLSVLSLYHVLALQAEVEGLRAEVVRKREEQSGKLEDPLEDQEKQAQQQKQEESKDRIEMMSLCAFVSEFALEICTAVPWQTGLKRGSALEEEQGIILVKSEGFFYIYSQVYYIDPTFAMGHIVIRIKKNVVGDESQQVVLFRCIQSMNPVNHFNTCYTAGIVKLDSGDKLELLIPRPQANISLDGDSTFFGAIKLA
ncbi:Tumor necrosis factor ligand superfamily member 13B B lymphocyte stimulator [Triplophysa tibetana]|uniref:Tumor necrosis factor ligand superfamily member 13B B lymphocyte stimulator n=1 Tax=Triplophysa tibetana TaxID=1572043 RepID=A0A5A9P297_9TELE|nr:Tumor necrosis factor ligand superfamily member 13B B lymphocyte stimulator [Triplophysa tibetana]